MTTRAHVQYRPERDGLAIAVVEESEGYLGRRVLQWPLSVAVKQYSPEDAATQASDEDWLVLREDHARAIYEALADHFGHAGHDTRSLRKDYDAERARVDKFINTLTGGTR